jgi:hypothetical protein
MLLAALSTSLAISLTLLATFSMQSDTYTGHLLPITYDLHLCDKRGRLLHQVLRVCLLTERQAIIVLIVPGALHLQYVFRVQLPLLALLALLLLLWLRLRQLRLDAHGPPFWLHLLLALGPAFLRPLMVFLLATQIRHGEGRPTPHIDHPLWQGKPRETQHGEAEAPTAAEGGGIRRET